MSTKNIVPLLANKYVVEMSVKLSCFYIYLISTGPNTDILKSYEVFTVFEYFICNT